MVSPDTQAVHSGTTRGDAGAVAPPVVLSSTFDYPELADGSAAPYIYTRYDNPTLQAVETRLAALEAAEDAAVFSSGMAAIAGALLSLLRSGDRIVSSSALYGGTRTLFETEFPDIGIGIRYLDDDVLADPSRLADTLDPVDKVLYLESPTNPMLRVLDVPALTAAAHNAGLHVVLDNTFAGPLLARPTEWGVDLVCESASKTMGGHSDLIAGVVAGAKPFMERVRLKRRHWGTNLDPDAAYRLFRGLATLPVRVRRAGATAVELAERLAAEPWVEAVHHPSLSTHPDHEVAARTLNGPVPLVSFVMAGGEAAAVALRRHVELVRPAASLGGVETLLSLPSETSHVSLGEEGRRREGIPPGSVRLAVGLEDPVDLLADLRRAAGHV